MMLNSIITKDQKILDDNKCSHSQRYTQINIHIETNHLNVLRSYHRHLDKCFVGGISSLHFDNSIKSQMKIRYFTMIKIQIEITQFLMKIAGKMLMMK